jgi:hypothetical protein
MSIPINFDQVIPPIVEAMLPRHSPENIALSVTLDLRESDRLTEKSAATICRFLFHRPTNYTKVLVNYKFNNYDDLLNPQSTIIRYEKHSDHDSCWKSDGLTILSVHWNNIRTYFNKHQNDVDRYYNFSIFDGIKYVKLTTFEPIKQKEDNWIRSYDVKYKPIKYDGSNILKLIEDK